MKNEPGSLEGKFFHSLKSGRLEWQGTILCAIAEGYYLCELLDWNDDKPILQKIVSITDLTAWNVYDTKEQQEYWLKNLYKPKEAAEAKEDVSAVVKKWRSLQGLTEKGEKEEEPLR